MFECSIYTIINCAWKWNFVVIMPLLWFYGAGDTCMLVLHCILLPGWTSWCIMSVVCYMSPFYSYAGLRCNFPVCVVKVHLTIYTLIGRHLNTMDVTSNNLSFSLALLSSTCLTSGVGSWDGIWSSGRTVMLFGFSWVVIFPPTIRH